MEKAEKLRLPFARSKHVERSRWRDIRKMKSRIGKILRRKGNPAVLYRIEKKKAKILNSTSNRRTKTGSDYKGSGNNDL